MEMISIETVADILGHLPIQLKLNIRIQKDPNNGMKKWDYQCEARSSEVWILDCGRASGMPRPNVRIFEGERKASC